MVKCFAAFRIHPLAYHCWRLPESGHVKKDGVLPCLLLQGEDQT
jgi:hypothetical protein